MSALDIVALVAVGGLVLVGVYLCGITGRGYTSVDRANNRAEKWRQQAHRDALTAQHLRHRLENEAFASHHRTAGWSDPEPRRRFDPRAVPVPDADPPIAAELAATVEMAKVPDAGGPIGGRTRPRKAASS